jgi:uncharacterized protein (TIGR00369 family)
VIATCLVDGIDQPAAGPGLAWPPVDDLIDAPVRGSYPDPRILRLNGMERMDLMREGRWPAPPTHYLCGLVPTDWSPGRAAFAMPASPWFLVTRGIVSPGVVALVADAPLGVAFATTLPAGVVTTTSELTINYLRPIRVRRLAARATLIDASPYQGLIEASVLDDDGRMVAHLTSRYVTLRPEVDLSSLDGDLPPNSSSYGDHPGLQETPITEDEIEAFGRTIAGELPRPPICRLLGMSLPEVEEGRMTVTVPASPWYTSPASSIYGGLTALLLEIVSSGAVGTTLPAEHSCAPLDMKVQYLRPWLADGARCTVGAEVIHRGRTMAVTRAEIRNGDGKIVALATGSALVIQRPWSDLARIDALPAREPRA